MAASETIAMAYAWAGAGALLFAAIVVVVAIVIVLRQERAADEREMKLAKAFKEREDTLQRELDFRREQARFEGMDKRLTQVLPPR